MIGRVDSATLSFWTPRLREECARPGPLNKQSWVPRAAAAAVAVVVVAEVVVVVAGQLLTERSEQLCESTEIPERMLGSLAWATGSGGGV